MEKQKKRYMGKEEEKMMPMNKDLKIFVAIFVATFLFACVDFVLADNSFTRETYGSASGNPLNAYAVSQLIYTPVSCTLGESAHFTATSTTSYTLNYEFFAPHLTSKGTGSIPSLQNVNCLGIGDLAGLTDSNQSRYEARLSATHGATTTNTGYMKSTLSCSTPSNLVTVGSNGEKDSQGNLVNLYGSTASGVASTGWTTVINSLKSARHSQWQTFYADKESSECVTAGKATSASASNMNNLYYLCVMETLPFNSGGEGKASVRILPPLATVTGTAPNSGSYIEYFPVDNPSEAVALYSSGNWIAGSGAFTPIDIDQNLTLTADKDYVIVSYYCGEGSHSSAYAYFTFTNSRINVTYSVYNPDWNCTEWNNCSSGIQTRTCADLNGIAQTKIESRSCFVTPSVEVNLGFEDFVVNPDDTFMCGKSWGFCFDQLYTKDSSIPKDWYLERTFATELFGTTASLENFCEGSSETSYTGSKSLKCWSLPPSSGQPLPVTTFLGDDVVCGDYNQTREPEVIGLFNESLFIAYNVSFATPYVNLHWATKKCSSAPIQYKYGNGFGACGDKCYGDCNQTPTGWYSIKMADIGEGIHGYVKYPYTAMRYSPYLSPTELDYTDSVSNIDSDSTLINGNYWEESEYSTLTLNTGNFTDGMNVAFYVLPTFGNTDVPVYLTDVTGTTIYGSFITPSSIFAWDWRNVTLQNMTGVFGEGTNIIYLHEPLDNNPASIQFYVDYIAIETYEEFVYVDTLFEFDEEATADWSQKMLDLTNLGIVPNHNYTIGFRISPQYETTASNCLYFDDVTGTYTETTVSVCESYCDGYTQYEAREHGDICLYTITENSPKCRGVSESEKYDSFCTGTTLNYFDNVTGFWYELNNATECYPTEAEQTEESLYQPPAIIGSILDAFGATEGSELEGVRFFLSTFMLATYIILIVGSGLTILPFFVAPKNSMNVKESTMLGLTGMFILTLALTVGGFYPQWIGWTIIVFTGLLLAYLGREIFTKNT